MNLTSIEENGSDGQYSSHRYWRWGKIICFLDLQNKFTKKKCNFFVMLRIVIPLSLRNNKKEADPAFAKKRKIK
jgi:hypothetical protein